jgi:hypothetical protein
MAHGCRIDERELAWIVGGSSADLERRALEYGGGTSNRPETPGGTGGGKSDAQAG